MENTSNFLVPKHRKLNSKEVSLLLEKYNLPDVSKLPKIKIKDAGIKHLNPEIGDVFEIERKSFAGKVKYYRVVVE